jgi:hypothetical protein
MLMLARPFSVGDQVRMRAGALGGEIQGTVTDIGITYVRLDTTEGLLSVPNALALTAVVGPMRADESQDPVPAADPAAAPAGTGPGAPGPVTATAATAAAVTSPGPGTVPRAGSGPPPPGPGDGTRHEARP